MTNLIIIGIFVAGYVAIAFERSIKINKAASALISGVLCWTVYILSSQEKALINTTLINGLGEIASILFFLLGAMVVVQLIDTHDGFNLLTDRMKTSNKGTLLVMITVTTFFLSSVLDNLTTTIIMLSLTRKLLDRKEDRLYFAGMVIIAANAGGVWSPLGDITITMLWIGKQVTARNIIMKLFFPALVSALVPMLFVLRKFRRKKLEIRPEERTSRIPDKEKMIMLSIGLGSLLFVPVFKVLTDLPPFMGMMLSLGLMWTLTSYFKRHSKNDEDAKMFSVTAALQKIDSPSILFFLGILLAVSALQASGILSDLATMMRHYFKTDTGIGLALGMVSAIVDNVPLVAAVQGAFDLQHYPTNHFLWELLAFTTGTGGSVIIIGSAAGVAAMGIEDIHFMWYLKRISWLAFLGFLAGTMAYILTVRLG